MTKNVQPWQWPNLLALDASLIAMSWLWVFSAEQAVGLSTFAYAVLGLSVWLTYMADRLFDIHHREEAQLLSTRHRVTKEHRKRLWCIWAAVLTINLGLAFAGLSSSQMNRGWLLLFLCLSYTGLNQCLSKSFFPKEILVALIFTGGTQIFLPNFSDWPTLLSFSLLCLINCLLIAWQERPVDRAMGVRSLSSATSAVWVYPMILSGLLLSIYSSCPIALVPTYCLIAGIQLSGKAISREVFRVLSDAALLSGPLIYFLFSGVLVR